MGRIQTRFIILLMVLTISSWKIHAKQAIVIGASSGIGREVARRLSAEGYTLGLVARRLPLLESLQKELPYPSYTKQIDVNNSDARHKFLALIQEMGTIDLIVISIGAYCDNRNAPLSDDSEKEWIKKERTLDIDAKGFIKMADVALHCFRQQKHGHLVGISSSAGLRGKARVPEYSAAKAGISCYMEGIRNAMVSDKLDITVTNVIPGFVAVEHSPFGEDPNAYWEITVQEAGETILAGIKRKSKIIYVPSKIWLLAIALKFLPDFLYQHYMNWA